MSYSFDAPLPKSFYYPVTYPVEDTSESLPYQPTDIQHNVSPLFDENLYRSPDIPSLALGWQDQYWPSPTSPNSEHAFSSGDYGQGVFDAMEHSTRFEYSSNSGYSNATPTHLSTPVVAMHPSEIEMSTLPPISDGLYPPEESGIDVDVYGEMDSEYESESTLSSDSMTDGGDDEYLPPSSLNSSKRARPSTAHTNTRRVSRPTRTTRKESTSSCPPPHAAASVSPQPGGVYPIPPYVFTPTRTEQAPPGTPHSLPPSTTAASKCPLCSYRSRQCRLPDLRRHYESHFVEESLEYVCCGVRIDRVEEYSAVAAVEGDVYLHKGEVRIGQCWKVCSRSDALKRHLDDSATKCTCDVRPAEYYARAKDESP